MSIRLRGLLRTELRLLRRYWVLASVLGLSVLWTAVLLLAAPALRLALLPWILLLDLTALGFFFVPVMTLVETAEGTATAMAATPVRPAERLAVRVATLTALAVVASVPVVAAARRDATGLSPPAVALLGVALTTVGFSLLARLLVAGTTTFTGFMTRVPAAALPLLGPAVLDGLDLWRSPLLGLSPATGALRLLSGRASPGAIAYLALGSAFLAVVASRRAAREVESGGAAGGRPIARATTAAHRIPHPGRFRLWTVLSSMARTDRRALLRDSLLVMLLVGVPLVALGVRLAGTWGMPWLQDRWGWRLAPDLPLLWAFLLVVHTPVMFGAVAGLLLLEDRDQGLLPVLATTRASLRLLLAYRLLAAAATTFLMLALGAAIAGMRHAAGPSGLLATLLAAAALAPVTGLVLAAFASNRVQALALWKLASPIFYLPLVAWWLGPTWRRSLLVLPSSWAVETAWASSAGASWLYALGGVTVAALVSWPLWRRFERHAW